MDVGKAVYRGVLPDSFVDSLSIDSQEPRWRERLLRENEQTMVAEQDSNVVGFITVGLLGRSPFGAAVSTSFPAQRSH